MDLLIYGGRFGHFIDVFWVLGPIINYDAIKINKQSIEGSECTWPFSLTYSGFSPVIDAGPPS